MKIHLFDTDNRKLTDPSYETNKGSFGVVAAGLNAGLKEIDAYSEPDDADFVGICDGLNLGFKYKNKKSFVINVWDMINVLPVELIQAQKQTGQRMLGLSNQITELWRKNGVKCDTVMPGCDTEFWKPTIPKNEKFTFLFNSFANVRSGLDVALLALVQFETKTPIKFILKNTSNSPRLEKIVKDIQAGGFDLEYINERISFTEMRDIYSKSHVALNIHRHSSWGLPVHEAAACGCLPVVGDFCPSNEMGVDLMVPPSQEVEIPHLLPRLTEFWGLHNAYGSFNYLETPKFHDYHPYDIWLVMRQLYLRWGSEFSKIDCRKQVVENWTWKKSAESLVAALKND